MNPSASIEIWGGLECTVNRVGDRWFDQIRRTGHDTRIEDLDRFAALGITAIRYPVLWERHAPDSLDDLDWTWSDQRLARLRDLGIRPIVGLLHHGSGPRYTSLIDPRFPELLARFARAVAERYPWVTDFTPINEPLTTARFSGLYGHWYPHLGDDRAFVRAFVNQMRGIALAMDAIRQVSPGARLVQTEDCGLAFGTQVAARQVAFEEHRRWLTWDVLSGRVDDEHPLYRRLLAGGATAAELAMFADGRARPNVIGLNYYLTSDRYLDDQLDRYPPCLHGGNGTLAYADVEAVRVRADGIVGHEEHLRSAWERYRIPVAITEVHLGCSREEQVRWLLECWRGASRARAAGADVRAITPWALLGSFDWNTLVTVDAGHYEPGAFDVRAPRPRATAVATAVRSLARGEEPSHPAFEGPGWWRRPDRLIYRSLAPSAPAPAAGTPIAIIGATGTLGRALHRICTLRGLRSQLLARSDVDITDPTAVDAMIRHLRPWAVINAAGYVRVDDAEQESDACRRGNVSGPVTLAAACRRRGLPLVTFSSDLVFDGKAGRAYTEDDEPSPLNVYGRTKLEAEQRVLDLLPDALVIRTSAFFGPWDDYNFLACLMRALDRGDVFEAPSDTIVSPTYVPDLAHATLDLLIDGERGLWHLANTGAVSWYDFARAAAQRTGRPVDLIRPVETSAMWKPARRPAYSALASTRGWIMRSLDHALDSWAQAREERCAAAAGRS